MDKQLNNIEKLMKESSEVKSTLKTLSFSNNFYRGTNEMGYFTRDSYGLLPPFLFRVQKVLFAAYGKDSLEYVKFMEISNLSYLDSNDDSGIFVSSKISSLFNFINSLLLEIDERKLISAAGISKIENDAKKMSNKVFIVHGRNHQWLNEIEQHIESLGYTPVVLYKDQQPGHTIIEKLEIHTDVFAAVILLTPDDKGGLISEDNQKTRARQNVVFEYGFFSGVIGRKNIILIDFGVEDKPSDMHGIAYNETSHGNIDKAKHEIAESLIKIKNNVRGGII